MIETKNLGLIPCGPSHPETVPEDGKGLEPLPGARSPAGRHVSPRTITRTHEKLANPPAVGWRGLVRRAFPRAEAAAGRAGTLRRGPGREDSTEGGTP